MSKYSSNIHTILRAAESKKVTEKKKCIQELLRIYENEEAVKEISKNTTENVNGIVNWPCILHTVHRLILNEADRLATKDVSKTSNERQNTCNAMLNTIRLAHNHAPLTLKCSVLLPIVLQILEKKIYEPYYDTYLIILVTYVLPVRQYQINISMEQWEELLKICMRLYENISTYISRHILLNALHMIVHYGCLQSNLALKLKVMLPFLAKIFQYLYVKSNEQTLEKTIYKLANTVCYQIATENRIVLCQFGENILPNIIDHSNYDEQYKFMLLIVQLHHPKGVCEGHNAAFACNWDNWNIILQNMYEMILRNCKKTILSQNFIYFATEVFNQILQCSYNNFKAETSTEYFPVQLPKRRRIINGPVNIIALNNSENAWPLIQIFTVLFAKYPNCLKPHDFIAFLTFVMKLLKESCKDEKIMDSLYEMITVLIEIEKLFSNEIEDTKMHWYNIWDILLRSLSMNQNEISGHRLVQYFIRNNKIKDTNSLLTLYFSETMKWSTNSLHTLILFFKNVPLPDDITMFNIKSFPTLIHSHTAQMYSMQWLLNTPWHKSPSKIFIETLCDLLINISVKSYKKQFQCTRSSLHLHFSETYNFSEDSICTYSELISYKNIEQCNLALSFENDIFKKESSNVIQSPINRSINRIYTEDVLHFLTKNLCELLIKSDEVDDLCTKIMKTALVARVISTLKELQPPLKETQLSPLLSEVKKSLQDIHALLANITPLENKYSYLVSTMKALNILYGASYNMKMSKIITSSLTVDTIRNIFCLLNIEDTNNSYYNTYCYNRDFNIFKDEYVYDKYLDKEETSAIRIYTMKTLILFCCMNTGEDRFEMQVNLIQNLLTIDMYDFLNEIDFKIAMTVLELFIDNDKRLMHIAADKPVKFFLELFQKCSKDAKYVQSLFKVLPCFLEYTARYNYDVTKIIDILSKFRMNSHKRNFGPLVHISFLKCLSKIIQLAHIFPQNVQYDYWAEIRLLIENLLFYIDSPFYVIRLQALQCIKVLYTSQDIDFTWKECFFNRIKDVVKDVLLIDKELDESLRADETETRITSVLLLLGIVISSSCSLQNNAFLTMLQLLKEKHIKIKTIQKMLHTLTAQTNYRYLTDDTLSYLLSHWLTLGSSIQTFPWILMNCESQEQFYNKYLDILIYIQMQAFDINNAIELCNSMKLPFQQVLENILPQILSWLLYWVSKNDTKYEDDHLKVQLATKMLHKLISNEGEFKLFRNFMNLFKENFDKIILNIIKKLHDEDYYEEIFKQRFSFPESSPPHLKKTDVDKCWKYIEDHFVSSKKSLQYILSNEYSSALQKILLNLTSNIYDQQFLEHKLKAFHQYIYFCEKIIQYLKEEYFNTLSMYIVRDISYTLLHFIKADVSLFSELACKYFHTFLKCVLPEKSVEIETVFGCCVTTLVEVVQSGKIPTAIQVLKFLIIEQNEVLKNSIEKLDFFPNVPLFQEIHRIHNSLKYKERNVYTLEEEMRHFLNAVDKNIINISKDSLSHLIHHLSIKRDQLQDMYNKLEKFNDSVEDNVTVLHHLIYKLVEIVKSCNDSVSIEAAKCLGQLGPAALKTTTFYLKKHHNKENVNIMITLTCKVVILLTKFLTESDIHLRKVSANALYSVLSSEWGQKLVRQKKTNTESELNDLELDLNINYIYPFINKSESRMQITINNNNFEKYMNPSNFMWKIKPHVIYNEWILQITSNIALCFSGFYLDSLIPVCELNIEICEILLPRLIFLIIHLNKELSNAVCQCINKFFQCHINIINNQSSELTHLTQKDKCCNRKIVQCMLNVVNYIRIQIADNIQLDFNFLYIAKAAQYCSAYFTTILYAEFSYENLLNKPYNFSNIPKIDYVYECNYEQGKMLQDLLIDTYLKIDDPDAIRGCGLSHLQDRSSRVQHYIHMQKWDKVILSHDIELSFGNKSVEGEMMNALHRTALQHVLSNFIHTVNTPKEEMNNDIYLESLWRLSKWDMVTNYEDIYSNIEFNVTESDYQLYHYNALKCFHENDEIGVKNSLLCARTSIIKSLRNISLESNKILYQKLAQLQMLREIEELSLAEPNEYAKILHNWQNCNIANLNEFQYVEPILTQRTVMYQIKESIYNDPIIKSALISTYLEIAENARSQGHLQIATRALGSLAKQNDLPLNIRDILDYQESLLAWIRDDHEISRYLLRNLLNKDSTDPALQAQVLRVYGNWMAETKSENPQSVIEKYYLESINISKSIKTWTSDIMKNRCDAQVALAKFADAQFQQISAYMKSSQYENFKECVQYSCQAAKLNVTLNDEDLRKAVIINKKQSTNDVAELESIQKENNNYLLIALRYYLLTLQQSEDYNLLVFQLIALWLENAQNIEVNKLLKENLDKIPSFKFIPLIPQLAAYISNALDVFSVKIYKILKQCALDHPHHTLPVLMALMNLYDDYKFLTTERNVNLKEEPRIISARKLLKELQTSKVSSIVQEMIKLSQSLVGLANFEISKSAGRVCKIPKNQEILKIKDFRNILVPTVTLQIQPSGNYDSIVGIMKYKETFETVGGVNAPKKLICVGTDGICRQQLLKAQDDLRQDAVMQQVFNVMNILLKTNKETRKRKLKIRTYKVVPLTQRSGILEWCSNTVPIVSVLVGSERIPGVHQKYYPNDYTADMCKKKMAAVSKASNDVKLKAFLDCCDHMHPAFHYFFMEKYPSPEVWFQKRLAYTRSVATTSISGYILGLGDRHLNNILIDQQTAEVIHIDFGIAFEQGKVLPIPETIPFRLTRDLEAAMGVSGIEGIMRRSCEETLTVLRDQRQIIITLLQVLRYDPLFTWVITPAKAYNMQTGNTARSSENNLYKIARSETNKTAERALLRIEQKLQGTEEGLASSIPGQVERLIQQARDASNLSCLFCGWQPYL